MEKESRQRSGTSSSDGEIMIFTIGELIALSDNWFGNLDALKAAIFWWEKYEPIEDEI